MLLGIIRETISSLSKPYVGSAALLKGAKLGSPNPEF